ncbi:MAG: DUF1573 domain-containing protein [Bacteroidales bacterium]|nr:DUF1573 domain-containing protein [Bacteroidales bacterium]
MKIWFVIAMVAIICLACNTSNNEVNVDLIQNPLSAQQNNDTSILPKFQWKEQVHDFGVVIQGERVSYTYTFKNVGKSNLIISSVTASCGCTVTKYDQKPIAPGEEGKIEIVFDSSGRSGIQNKTVTVVANTQPNRVELHFTAEVVKPEN